MTEELAYPGPSNNVGTPSERPNAKQRRIVANQCARTRTTEQSAGHAIGAIAACIIRLIIFTVMLSGVNGRGSKDGESVDSSSSATGRSGGIVGGGLRASMECRSARLGEKHVRSPGLQLHRPADTASGSRGWRGRKRSRVAPGADGQARATGSNPATETNAQPDGSQSLQLHHLPDVASVVHCRGDWKRSLAAPDGASEWAPEDHNECVQLGGALGGNTLAEDRGRRSVRPYTLHTGCPYLQLYHPAETPLTGRGWRDWTRSTVALAVTCLTHAKGYSVLELGAGSSPSRRTGFADTFPAPNSTIRQIGGAGDVRTQHSWRYDSQHHSRGGADQEERMQQRWKRSSGATSGTHDAAQNEQESPSQSGQGGRDPFRDNLNVDRTVVDVHCTEKPSRGTRNDDIRFVLEGRFQVESWTLILALFHSTYSPPGDTNGAVYFKLLWPARSIAKLRRPASRRGTGRSTLGYHVMAVFEQGVRNNGMAVALCSGIDPSGTIGRLTCFRMAIVLLGEGSPGASGGCRGVNGAGYGGGPTGGRPPNRTEPPPGLGWDRGAVHRHQRRDYLHNADRDGNDRVVDTDATSDLIIPQPSSSPSSTRLR